tara:strand:- start:3765 stop:4766 length:1002 start_codon:yes stop_codon:yes gene_type:complete
MLKIDIHTHIIPEKIPDFSKKFGYEGFVSMANKTLKNADMMIFGEKFRTIKCNCWSVKERISDMNKHKIDVQVLSPIPVMFCYWARPKDTLMVSQFLNDFIMRECQKYPKNFIGLGTVPMQDTKLSILELERCKEIGLMGIEIGSNINNKNLSDNDFHPFYEAAEELNMPLFIHPWEMMGMSQMSKYWLPWLVGMPAETSRAICSMIFGGIFEKFPNLRVAFAHGGGSFPHIVGRIEKGFLERPDLCAIDNQINPKTYLGKFYVDSLVHSQEALSYLINILGPNSVILGSDYPFPLGEKIPGREIEISSNIDDKVKNNLLNKNALNWLGVEKI